MPGSPSLEQWFGLSRCPSWTVGGVRNQNSPSHYRAGQLSVSGSRLQVLIMQILITRTTLMRMQWEVVTRLTYVKHIAGLKSLQIQNLIIFAGFLVPDEPASGHGGARQTQNKLLQNIKCWDQANHIWISHKLLHRRFRKMFLKLDKHKLCI